MTQLTCCYQKHIYFFPMISLRDTFSKYNTYKQEIWDMLTNDFSKDTQKTLQ